MKNATFRQLRVFNEVARHLNFSKAAQALHLSPPAVTQQIKELEGHVGLPLFDRVGRRVNLTTTGEYMLVYVRRILATIKEAEDATARLRGLAGGRLVVGMVSTAKYLFPHLLADFRRKYPGVEVQLHTGNRATLVRQLSDNELDLAFMGNPPSELAARAEPFAAHPLGFVAGPDHPLAQLPHVELDELANWPWIAREPGSGTRALMERFFQTLRSPPAIVMEMTSNEAIKQAVMAGMGLSFLSLHTLALERQHGLLMVLSVPDTPIVRRWHVVSQPTRVLSPAAEALRHHVLAEGERFIARYFGQSMPDTDSA